MVRYKSYMNSAHQSVKVEDIYSSPTKIFAITIAPSNQLDIRDPAVKDGFLYRTKDRIKAFKVYSKQALQDLQGSAYKLYFEISPLGIMHWHGFLHIIDIEDFMLNDLGVLKHIGAFCIREITDMNAWHVYCVKQGDLFLIHRIQSLCWKEEDELIDCIKDQELEFKSATGEDVIEEQYEENIDNILDAL